MISWNLKVVTFDDPQTNLNEGYTKGSSPFGSDMNEDPDIPPLQFTANIVRSQES